MRTLILLSSLILFTSLTTKAQGIRQKPLLISVSSHSTSQMPINKAAKTNKHVISGKSLNQHNANKATKSSKRRNPYSNNIAPTSKKVLFLETGRS